MDKTTKINNLKSIWFEAPEVENERGDLRGAEVYDFEHSRVGIISEIYCCADDLTAKFLEIIPFDKKDDMTYTYPFDMVTWRGDGPAFIASSYDSLKAFKDYDADYVLCKEGNNLITYNEALDQGLGLNFVESDLRECA